MYKRTKTQLQFILGGILLLTIAVAACNDSKTDATNTEVKTTVVPPAVKDSMDSIPGNQAPTPGGGGN